MEFHPAGFQPVLVEGEERPAPVDRLGDARQLEQVGAAQLLDEATICSASDSASSGARRAGSPAPAPRPDSRSSDRGSAVQRVVDLPRAVRGQHDDGRRGGGDRAHLRDRDLEVAQDLQQEGLERLVRAVELVHQQHRRPRLPRSRRLERQQERALEEEAAVEDVVRQALALLITGSP